MKELPKTLGKTYIIRLIAVYSRLFYNEFGFRPTIQFGLFGKIIKELIDSKTEVQIAALMVVFFEWNGMNGADIREHQSLVNSGFSIAWFSKCINTYEIYLRNVLGVNVDNEEEVYRFVSDHLSKLTVAT